MSVRQQEMRSLLERDQSSAEGFSSALRRRSSAFFPRKSTVQTSIKIAAAPFEGASAYYSTFGTLAVRYEHPGLWVIAPVGVGAAISITSEALAALAERYPDDQFLKTLNEGLFFASKGIGGVFEKVGFAWENILAAAAFIGGIELVENNFAKMYSLPLVLGVAIPAAVVNYNRAQGVLTERSKWRHLSEGCSGLSSAAGVVGMLLQQEIIKPDSFIPSAVIATTGALGVLSSATREYSPRFSQTLSMIIGIFENLSLTASFINFPLSIDAALRNDTVPELLFYIVIAAGALFFMTLTINQILAPAAKKQATITEFTDVEEGLIINADDAEEVEEIEVEESQEPEAPVFKRQSRLFTLFTTANDVTTTQKNDVQATMGV